MRSTITMLVVWAEWELRDDSCMLGGLDLVVIIVNGGRSRHARRALRLVLDGHYSAVEKLAKLHGYG